MKIPADTPQAVAAAETAGSMAEKTASAQQRQQSEIGERGAAQADRVTLSPSLTEPVENRQEQQAQRVGSIKARVRAGTYQVNSRDVAEKMLSVLPNLAPPPEERR